MNVQKRTRLKVRLIRKIQPLLEPLGIRKENIVNAVEKSLMEIERDGTSVHPWLLPMVFHKIFKTNDFFLINPRTPDGNAIPFHVQTAAYAIWRGARQTAILLGMDELDAVKALIHVVNVITDNIANGTGKPIRNIHKYMFAGYVKKLKRIIGSIGIAPQDPNPKKQSDDGCFIDALENVIFCVEITSGLSEEEKNTAKLRFMGYSCEETAAMLGLSNSAARQTLSRALKKMRRTCTRKMRASDYEEIIKTRKKRR